MARRWEQQSEIGRFLDPIADKLLVSATLFMLTAFGRLSAEALLPALVILCREILVSGLREYLAGLRVGMPVSRLAKWKTVIQMVAIGVLIVGDAGPGFVPVTAIGETLLWIAAILTLVTGYDYLQAGLRHMARPRGAPASRNRSIWLRPLRPPRSSPNCPKKVGDDADLWPRRLERKRQDDVDDGSDTGTRFTGHHRIDDKACPPFL
jgi:cardiolipin synthase